MFPISCEPAIAVLLRRQLPQHVLQNAAVLVVLDLLRCVDANPALNVFFSAVSRRCLHGHVRDRSRISP